VILSSALSIACCAIATTRAAAKRHFKLVRDAFLLRCCGKPDGFGASNSMVAYGCGVEGQEENSVPPFR